MEAQDVAEMATINTKNYESITRKKAFFIWREQYRKGLWSPIIEARRVRPIRSHHLPFHIFFSGMKRKQIIGKRHRPNPLANFSHCKKELGEMV